MATDAYVELVIGFMLDAAATLPMLHFPLPLCGLGTTLSKSPEGASPQQWLLKHQVARWMFDGGLVLKGL